MTRYGTIALVAGASSGIGKACAGYLRHLGCHVYGTYRTTSCQGVRTESSRGGFSEMIPMDVHDDASVDGAVAHVLKRESTLNILIDSAGFSLAGPLRQVPQGRPRAGHRPRRPGLDARADSVTKRPVDRFLPASR